MTLELPACRQQRLRDILAKILPDQKRLSLRTWHQLLGELRSMAIAIPGARGLFSALQAATHSNAHGRLRLTPSFHNAIDDFRWMEQSLCSRPTRLYELVPAQPSLIGSHDASGLGAGGGMVPQPRYHASKCCRPDSSQLLPCHKTAYQHFPSSLVPSHS